MLIYVDLEGCYEWTPSDKAPTMEDVTALRAKQAGDGKWLWKSVSDRKAQTEVSIPESQVESTLAHFERVGAPKSRAKVAAWLLEEKVLPHHAHPDHFAKFTVHDEPEVEAFLNRYFGTEG